MANMMRGRLPDRLVAVTWRGLVVVDDRLTDDVALVAWQAERDANWRAVNERRTE